MPDSSEIFVRDFSRASSSSQTRAVCLFDRSSLEIGSISITCEKNNIVSVCGNSRFSYPFSSPFFFHWRTPLSWTSINSCTGAMNEEQEMEAVCLSRLYFALNRIQGSLQIDKKKKKRRETSILECSKSRNDTCTKKKKTKWKGSTVVV